MKTINHASKPKSAGTLVNILKAIPLAAIVNSLLNLLRSTPAFVGNVVNTAGNFWRWARSRRAEQDKRKLEAKRELEEAAVRCFLKERRNLPEARFHAFGPKGFIACGNELETVKQSVIAAGYGSAEKHLLVTSTNAETGSVTLFRGDGTVWALFPKLDDIDPDPALVPGAKWTW